MRGRSASNFHCRRLTCVINRIDVQGTVAVIQAGAEEAIGNRIDSSFPKAIDGVSNETTYSRAGVSHRVIDASRPSTDDGITGSCLQVGQRRTRGRGSKSIRTNRSAVARGVLTT